MKAINFDPSIHKIIFINEPQTVLTETNILFLKKMFRDEESYKYCMKTLWILRALAEKKCDKGGITLDSKDEAFPIFKVLNELISSLLRNDTFFDEEGNLIN